MSVVEWETFLGEPDVLTHTGLLLAEDAALKQYVSGLSVPDRTGALTIPVPVWFRFPEGERRKHFPFITIDFLTIQPSYERWTSIYKMHEDGEAIFFDVETGTPAKRGMYNPSVAPVYEFEEPEDPPDAELGLHVDPMLMHTLMYQVTVHARSSLHDRFLVSRFFTDIFPPRPFFIGVDADETLRRTELVRVDQSDTMETTESGDKRVFRKIYTIRMDAEIPQSRAYEIAKVGRIHVDLYGDIDGDREATDHLTEDEHLIATPINVEPEEEP